MFCCNFSKFSSALSSVLIENLKQSLLRTLKFLIVTVKLLRKGAYHTQINEILKLYDSANAQISLSQLLQMKRGVIVQYSSVVVLVQHRLRASLFDFHHLLSFMHMKYRLRDGNRYSKPK